MYIAADHAVRDLPTLYNFIQENPLGAITTAITCPGLDTLQSTHIPWVLTRPDSASSTSLGILRGHLARANPQTKAMLSAAAPDGYLPDEVLILFTSEIHSYVSAAWMESTLAESGKVAPTWQFEAVQVYGRLRVMDPSWHRANGREEEEEEARDWIESQLEALVSQSEASDPKPQEQWNLSMAPESYKSHLKKHLVGMQVDITKIEGRFKVGQDEQKGDYECIVKHFEARGTDKAVKMAEMMKAAACPV